MLYWKAMNLTVMFTALSGISCCICRRRFCSD